MRRTIAPMLLSMLERPYPVFAGREMEQAKREIRAMLAVARAARSVARIDGDGSNLEIPTEYWTPLQKMHGALARLDRLSRPQRAGRGRP